MFKLDKTINTLQVARTNKKKLFVDKEYLFYTKE